jgi:predicted esterase
LIRSSGKQKQLSSQLPWCKFVLPTAPVNPVTLNGGMRMNSWYDIVGLDERSNEGCEGIQESRSRIEAILQRERDELGLPYSRMVLAGFSQGGALGLFTGLQLGGEKAEAAAAASGDEKKKLAGIVVLSGYLPCDKQFRITPGLEGTPVFHGQYVQSRFAGFLPRTADG